MATEPVCPDTFDMGAAVKPRTAAVGAGDDIRYTVEVRNNVDCPRPIDGLTVCAKATRKGQADLRIPDRCRQVPPVIYPASSQAKLRVKARARAAGRYKLRFVVRHSTHYGESTAAMAEATLKVRDRD